MEKKWIPELRPPADGLRTGAWRSLVVLPFNMSHQREHEGWMIGLLWLPAAGCMAGSWWGWPVSSVLSLSVAAALVGTLVVVFVVFRRRSAGRSELARIAERIEGVAGSAAAAAEVNAKVQGLGAGTPVRFLFMALFYCVVHSLLEEYYWRWFVFGELRQVQRWPIAAVVSGIGFTAHHVLVIGMYFGWSSPLTVLFSLAVTIGGIYWAWLYQRSGSLLGPWVSHLLIDGAIFVVGWDLLNLVN